MARKIEHLEAKRIGSRLRSARQARGMTLVEVGVQCGMHYTQVSKIERGAFLRINTNVQKLCNIFKLNFDGIDSVSLEELHARLDVLIRTKPSLASTLRTLFDAFDGMAK